MTKIKICGLGNAEQAIASADIGADYLGFVLIPGLRRTLSEYQVRHIVESYRSERGAGGPQLVGLFANQAVADVNRMLYGCSLDMAQLCGEETVEYCNSVEAPVIKQIRVPDYGRDVDRAKDIEQVIEPLVDRAHLPLLDKLEKGSLGGTGHAFDWSIAAYLSRKYKFLMAGGLTPQNVGLAITTASPWGVDVSSGIEIDGAKDVGKILEFALAVNTAR